MRGKSNPGASIEEFFDKKIQFIGEYMIPSNYHRKISTATLDFQSYFLRTFFYTAILLVFLLFALKPSFAQNEMERGTIFGTITDRVTSTPLFGASVNIVDTPKGAIAGEKGEYEIDRVSPGTYNIRFSMIGYQTLIKTNVSVSRVLFIFANNSG